MEEHGQRYDVVIVGASLAGASLALQLGKLGISVALIDKQQFPRRKACGEGLSDIALEALYRLGFSRQDIETLDGKFFYAYRLDFGRKSLRFATGKQEILKGVGIRRFCIDALLFDGATKLPSVTDYAGESVVSCHREEDSINVRLKSGEMITGSYLVLADGANSMGAAKLGISKTLSRRTNWGISYSLTGEYLKRTGEVLVLLRKGFEVYCTPVSDTILNVALLTTKGNMQRLQDPNLLNELLTEASEKSFFNGRTDERPIQVGPIGAKRAYYQGRVLLLGDAAESFDPVSGVGMTHGLLMAEFAAAALSDVLSQGASSEVAFEQYASESEEMSRPLRGFTRLTASLLRAPARQFLVPFVSWTKIPYLVRKSLSEGNPAICRSLLKLVGF